VPFSLVELQLLTGLSEGKTLSEIGRELHFSQPALSKALRSAEARLDLPLVEHRGRRLQLTAAGAELGRMARVALAQLRGLDGLVRELQSGQKGALRIAATMTPADYVLPAALVEFRDLYPNVDLSVRTVAAGDWRVLVNEGLDLGIGTRPTAPPGWQAEPLYNDRVAFFAPAGSRLLSARLRDVTVVAPWSRPYWVRILGELSARGIDLPRRMDVQPMSAVKHLVRAGHCVGALLESAVSAELREGQFVRLPVLPEPLEEPFYVIRPDVRQPLEIVDVFCHCLRRHTSAMFEAPGS
jgi:DNA-binding transcriptional LysR family regulator